MFLLLAIHRIYSNLFLLKNPIPQLWLLLRTPLCAQSNPLSTKGVTPLALDMNSFHSLNNPRRRHKPSPKQYALRAMICTLRVMRYTASGNDIPNLAVWIKKFSCFRKRIFWWGRIGSNYRPHACQACALTNWATPPYK